MSEEANMKMWIVLLSFLALPAWAQDDFLSETESAVETGASDIEFDMGRDPAAVPSTLNSKRSYPGGADEEDLRVLPALPEAALKTDSRSVQREVYKALYNQELKDDRHDHVEE
jgi:hypothetical protein